MKTQDSCKAITGSTLIGLLAIVGTAAGIYSLGHNLNEEGSLPGENRMDHHLTAFFQNAFMVTGNPETPLSITVLRKPAPSIACMPDGLCIRTNLHRYDANQAVGAKGIDLVDDNASIIEGLGKVAQSQPDTSRQFLGLIQELAVDGHTIALEERAVIEHFDGPDAMVVFNSPERYAVTLANVEDYLQAHPAALSRELQQVLGLAANNITLQANDFIGKGDPYSLNGATINPKFKSPSRPQVVLPLEQQVYSLCGGEQYDQCHSSKTETN